MIDPSVRSEKYNPHAIESKWQRIWEEQGLYRFDPLSKKPKFYQLTMFPYPSGNLHVGHWYSYCPPDARARYMRMQGHEVLFPMGFDAFGLPAENAAIKNGIHPKIWTEKNIEYMTDQFKKMGTMIDWSRKFQTCDPDYYRWNQWFFIQFYKRGLVYKKESTVNWDPVDQTVLANEQVVNGRAERSGALVERRLMNQWHFKITAYAEELLDFSKTDVPEKVRSMQTNWIGRSVGATISFETKAGKIVVFTTRPDTVMGATFLVLAPEHPLVAALTTPEQKNEVLAYIEQAKNTPEIERTAEGKTRTGVFLGSHAEHPLSKEPVPIYIADYVLATYGTGSVMAVPAHDTRDFEFANTFHLPIQQVVSTETPWDFSKNGPFLGEGTLVQSGPLNGHMGGKAHIQNATEVLESQSIATGQTTYRLRDWLVSRQRFWGTPIPIVYCTVCGEQPVPEDQLPVRLPDDAEFLPSGQSPLKTHPTWKHTECPTCKGPAERETDTMDTFVCSSWYMRRFLDPHNNEMPFDPEIAQSMQLNLYTGGVEHAILHLLYSRFWHKVMRDMGLVSTDEPFEMLRNQGMILAEDGEKMSKSVGNVVDPDDLVADFGSDTVRLYLMFLAPWEDGGPWNPSGITGPYKWLGRVWSLFFDESHSQEHTENVSVKDIRFSLHSTLKKVTQDLERFSFNTAIAALMEMTHTLGKAKRTPGIPNSPVWDEVKRIFNLMLAPFAPHIAEEIWHQLGHTDSVHLQSWPTFDPSALQKDTLEIVIQINGRLRGKIDVSIHSNPEDIIGLAKREDNIAKYLSDSEVIKEIYVPGKLVNFVIRNRS